mgnify:FL=1
MDTAVRAVLLRDVVLTELYHVSGVLFGDLLFTVEQSLCRVTDSELRAELSFLEEWRLVKKYFVSVESDRYHLTKTGRRIAKRMLYPEAIDRV